MLVATTRPEDIGMILRCDLFVSWLWPWLPRRALSSWTYTEEAEIPGRCLFFVCKFVKSHELDRSSCKVRECDGSTRCDSKSLHTTAGLLPLLPNDAHSESSVTPRNPTPPILEIGA